MGRLIALDSNGYQISYPTGVKTRTTRDKLIEHILGYQQADGSFDGLDGSEVEYTAMALLAPRELFRPRRRVGRD